MIGDQRPELLAAKSKELTQRPTFNGGESKSGGFEGKISKKPIGNGRDAITPFAEVAGIFNEADERMDATVQRTIEAKVLRKVIK